MDITTLSLQQVTKCNIVIYALPTVHTFQQHNTPTPAILGGGQRMRSANRGNGNSNKGSFLLNDVIRVYGVGAISVRKCFENRAKVSSAH